MCEFRRGDYIYYECRPVDPFRIGKIDDIIVSRSGKVIKVLRLLRRRDLVRESLTSVEDNNNVFKRYSDHPDFSSFTLKQKEDLKLRELFVSRNCEIISEEQIQSKCFVNLLSECDPLYNYLRDKDSFFYSLVLDPGSNKLFEEKEDIRVGKRYQAVIPSLKSREVELLEDNNNLETLVWTPDHTLSDEAIDNFILLTRTLGSVGKVLKRTSCIDDASLYDSIVAASRDSTTIFAMNMLHQNNYNVVDSVQSLFNGSVPKTAEDELEEWTQREGFLFQQAINKCGKLFHVIREAFMPWKNIKQLVEYYYGWKTTHSYKGLKSNKPKKISYLTKSSDSLINVSSQKDISYFDQTLKKEPNTCSTCGTFVEGSIVVSDLSRSSYYICKDCWIYWKKYGDF